MNIKWDANGYTENFTFVHKYGEDVLNLFSEIKGKKIMDLGCGNGALTKRLSDLGAAVTGVDASKELLDIAKSNYPALSFIQGDATEFKVDETYDGVFSNAVFHWIEKDKQKNMMNCVYNALKLGGEFVFELGGYGNNILIHEGLRDAFEKRGLSYQNPFYFPTIGAYASMLEECGFKVQYANLFDRFTELKGNNGLYDWIHMFLQKPFEGLAEDVKEDIIREVIGTCEKDLYKDDKWYADYVRLRMKAVKE